MSKSGGVGMEHLFDGRCAEGVSNLTIGAPGQETLRRVTKVFKEAAAACADRAADGEAPGGDGVIFQYGPRSGYGPFRDSVTKFLNEEYDDAECPVDGRTLVLTAGATVGLWLTATALLPAGKAVVFIESPSYFIALSILKKDLGHRPVAVRMSKDGSGVDLDAFEAAVAAEYAKRADAGAGKFWAMFYTVPTFHNPTGSLLSTEKSKRLVAIARKYDVLIFCDDVYNLLHYGEGSKSPRRLFSYDRRDDPDFKGNVVSNGSFSKILGPGFRVGWLETPPWIKESLKDTGIILSGGSINNVAAGVVGSAVDLGLQQEHLRHLRQLYRERLDAMFSVLDKDLPVGFTCARPGGGYFVWVTGPEGFDSEAFTPWCQKEHGVQVLPSVRCGERDQDPILNAFRLSFAFYEADELKEAMVRLCKAIKEWVNKA